MCVAHARTPPCGIARKDVKKAYPAIVAITAATVVAAAAAARICAAVTAVITI